jgi:glycosyltransferase involved in cell wall biosynthesis
MRAPQASKLTRVVLWGTYDTGKPRVRLLRDGLLRNGVEVLEIHSALWQGVEDKSLVRGLRRWARLAAAAVSAYPRLVRQYLQAPAHDAVLVAYPGMIDLFVLRMFAWWRRTPLAWDWFLSAYDTIVLDRKLVALRGPAAWGIRFVEWIAARLTDVAFMDTAAHARRMERLFGLPQGRLGSVWVGAEESAFRISASTEVDGSSDSAGRPFSVLFYGQLIPLHGISTIVEAAALMQEEDVEWLLVGRGQESGVLADALARHSLPRVRWVEWMDYRRLIDAMQRADIVLGIFGSSEKAGSVIPNKVFQAAMAGRPIITRDSPAIRELLREAPPLVQFVPAGDASALAAAVRLAKAGLAKRRGTQDLPIVAPFDTAAIGRQLIEVLTPRA